MRWWMMAVLLTLVATPAWCDDPGATPTPAATVSPAPSMPQEMPQIQVPQLPSVQLPQVPGVSVPQIPANLPAQVQRHMDKTMEEVGKQLPRLMNAAEILQEEAPNLQRILGRVNQKSGPVSTPPARIDPKHPDLSVPVGRVQDLMQVLQEALPVLQRVQDRLQKEAAP